MSIRQMNRAWDTPCETHTQKLVLIALADNSNDDGGCWPSLNTIARRCDLSRQGVIDQIAHFEKIGWMSVERVAGKVNRYTLTIPVNGVDQSAALTSQPRGRVVSTTLTGPVNPVDPNHKEPPKNRKSPQTIDDEEFLAEMRRNYDYLDIEKEMKRMRGWLMGHPGRQLTRRFIINWLNKQDQPIHGKTHPSTRSASPANAGTHNAGSAHQYA